MRVRGEPPSLGEFLAKTVQIPGVEPPLQVCPGVISRGGVTLKVNHIGGSPVLSAPEEMVESDFIERRARGIGGDMPADPVMNAVCLDHHRHRVPANITLDASFNLAV